MEIIKIRNVDFTYPEASEKALKNINLSINAGEFIVLCGKSGCGKSTLLRHLKPSLTPHGNFSGEIFYKGQDINKLDRTIEAGNIGYVLQNPDNQIVTDKVWHELAFGLESLGYDSSKIRIRVAEMASYFGIQQWFYKNVSELSGGQKQLLNLASIMAMNPEVLILDEPTSQLDPIAASDFLQTIKKINRDLGITVILSEHRLEEAFSMADRVVAMDKGEIICEDIPEKVGLALKNCEDDMLEALPTAMKVYLKVSKSKEGAPITVREGRQWLQEIFKEDKALGKLQQDIDFEDKHLNMKDDTEIAIELKDLWFRYERNSQDVIKGLNLKVKKGSFYSIVGGNGTGKSTTISLISGANKPYRGKVYINGKDIKKQSNRELFENNLGVMPQNPQSLFLKKTVKLDLLDVLTYSDLSNKEREKKVLEVADLLEISQFLNRHPYDLSGGEQQKLALGKILLMNPKILILDEPTKGIDSYYKIKLSQILKKLKERGITILMVTHDVEFAASNSDYCGMFFDGNIVTENTPREFFRSNNFYTTAANRMSRNIFKKAVTCEDLISLCIKNLSKDSDDGWCGQATEGDSWRYGNNVGDGQAPQNEWVGKSEDTISDKCTSSKECSGMAGQADSLDVGQTISRESLIKKKEVSDIAKDNILNREKENKEIYKEDRSKITGASRRTKFSAFIILILIPATIAFGMFALDDRSYYFISLLIIIYTMIPFFMAFEGRKPKARELIIIAVLSAIAVVGRMAFFAVPQFKPVVAIVIITGVCFGGESGFLTGAIAGFISNFFFGQGPWTPWQMFSFGIIGFLSGILFAKGRLKKNRISLCIFGGLATFIIYGFIMNVSSLFMFSSNISFKALGAMIISGVPFDLVHAAATVIFLFLISEPMIEKLNRIKIKYGLIES